jgi:hypothetical protein
MTLSARPAERLAVPVSSLGGCLVLAALNVMH